MYAAPLRSTFALAGQVRTWDEADTLRARCQSRRPGERSDGQQPHVDTLLVPVTATGTHQPGACPKVKVKSASSPQQAIRAEQPCRHPSADVTLAEPPQDVARSIAG